MSYCRFSESDVYLYESLPSTSAGRKNGAQITCAYCALDKMQDASVFYGEDLSEAAMLTATHVIEHMRAGHRVPEHAIWALATDAVTARGRSDSQSPTVDIHVEEMIRVIYEEARLKMP